MHAYIQNTSERFRYRKGGKKIISLANLSTFPRFLLFDRVILFYNKGSNEIEGKCQKIKKYMHPIKDALKDSIRFVGRIDQDDRECFRHHSMLLEHLSGQLLQMFDSSRRYEFIIYFRTDEEAATNVFSSILQIFQIRRCSNLEIQFCDLQQPMQFPVEAISSWLNRQVDAGMEVSGEIFLRIFVTRIQNAVGICDYLETVRFKLYCKPFKSNL